MVDSVSSAPGKVGYSEIKTSGLNNNNTWELEGLIEAWEKQRPLEPSKIHHILLHT